jgi:DNA repair protein RadC
MALPAGLTRSAMSIKQLPADARPREKLLARGASALSDTELLALLLRTGIKGKGVLQLADELLHLKKNGTAGGGDGSGGGGEGGMGGFDGIAGLLNASADDLKRVKGLGPAKRAELVAVLELARRALAQQLTERTVLATPEAMKHYLQLQLSNRPYEVFAVLFLDHGMRMITLEEMFRGTLAQTSVYPREVVLKALHHQASHVVLAHNHPSGSTQPSKADEALTRTLKAALALIDITVLDHVIVAPGAAFSMAERGLL